MSHNGDIDAGYRMSVEVLLNLNHDRYKSYFTQFIVLHFGIFTVYNSKNLEHLTCLLSAIGVILAIVWYRVLKVIIADIKKLWILITNYEEDSEQEKREPVKSIKINRSRDSLHRKKRGRVLSRLQRNKKLRFPLYVKLKLKVCEYGSGMLMLSVPILFIIVHGYIFFREIWQHLTCFKEIWGQLTYLFLTIVIFVFYLIRTHLMFMRTKCK